MKSTIQSSNRGEDESAARAEWVETSVRADV